MGIAMSLLEKLLKAFVSGQSGVRSGNSITTRCTRGERGFFTYAPLIGYLQTLLTRNQWTI